jgi:hypothetical protein
MSTDWLPPLVEHLGGDWDSYESELYRWFTADFITSQPSWPGKRVGLKRYPLSKNKEATFWHFISEGEKEEDRLIDLRRCERIRWPRRVMERFTEHEPGRDDPLVWWKNIRRNEPRYLLALPDFSYLVVVADRGDYVLPWTQYHVERSHQREKYRKEFNAYWREQKR